MKNQNTKTNNGNGNPPIEILDGYSKVMKLESYLFMIQFLLISISLTTIYLFLN